MMWLWGLGEPEGAALAGVGGGGGGREFLRTRPNSLNSAPFWVLCDFPLLISRHTVLYKILYVHVHVHETMHVLRNPATRRSL